MKKTIIITLFGILFGVAYSQTIFYRAVCRTHGAISSWHYDSRNAQTAKKHHEDRWSTRGQKDPNHAVTIEEKTN